MNVVQANSQQLAKIMSVVSEIQMDDQQIVAYEPMKATLLPEVDVDSESDGEFFAKHAHWSDSDVEKDAAVMEWLFKAA